MSKYKSKVDKIQSLSDDEIIKLHFDLQEEIKKQYKNREKKDCLDKAITQRILMVHMLDLHHSMFLSLTQ